MEKRQLALTLGSIITGFILVLSSCKKINESTELGGDLIPPIDNIHTFDTTLHVEAFNEMFTLGGSDPSKEDSTTSSFVDDQFLGIIGNDPIFGKTEAEMYLELKPAFYPFTFRNRPDSVFLDSVVLVLDYIDTYGDTTIPQQIDVAEITSTFNVDTYYIRKRHDILSGPSLGSRSVLPLTLDDSVKAYQDTTKNQLRIRLDDAFGNRLLKSFDTTTAAGRLNAYSTDSAFKSHFKGFALKSSGGNALMSFNLEGTNTKLAVYYRFLHGKPDGDIDTTVDYFSFKSPSTYGSKAGSAWHNYIGRDYAGTPVLAAQGGTTPDPIIYLQNTPGTFATVKVPGLAGLSNRVVHRAELIAEQVFDVSDSTFKPPVFLFLDAFVPSMSKYMTIPYDLTFDISGNINLGSFGIAPVNKVDGSGKLIRTWHFNVSRYVQHIVNGTESVYDFRIYAPFIASVQYRPPVVGSTPAPTQIGINPTPGKGRIRIAGNTGPADTNPQRLRLRIVYSKL